MLIIFHGFCAPDPNERLSLVDLAEDFAQRGGGGELFFVSGGVVEADDRLASDAEYCPTALNRSPTDSRALAPQSRQNLSYSG
jgi:hypothetical protein